jgi:hypothetical protein
MMATLAMRVRRCLRGVLRLAAPLPIVLCVVFLGYVQSADAAITITATAGQPFEGLLAEVAGLQCDAGKEGDATILWGDGSESSGTVTFKGSARLQVAGVHTYSVGGSYSGSITGHYHCQGSPFEYSATFNASVAAAPPSPPPTPTPPPVASASFSISSLAPGHAVLDATTSIPPGTSATRFSWAISGAGQPEIDCQGSEPQLTLMTRASMNTTVTLSLTDSTGNVTSTQHSLEIPGPPPHTASTSGLRHDTRARASAAAGITPGFTVLGECAGKPHPPLPPLSKVGAVIGAGKNRITVGGAPPPECAQDVIFGSADMQGCLEPLTNPQELPGGISSQLAKLLCGDRFKSFCVPALTAAAGAAVDFAGEAVGITTSRNSRARSAALLPSLAMSAVPGVLKGLGLPSYYSWSAVRIDGLDIDPREHQPILVIPSASVVVSPDATIYLHGIPISPVHAVALYLPAAGGTLGELSLPHKVPIIGSLPFSGSVSVALQRAGSTLSNGDTCQFDCAAISVFAELPGVFTNAEGGGLSARGVITADDQQGLQLDSLEVSIPHADIAGIGVEKVDFRYRHGDDSLRGEATLNLLGSGQITASFAFVHGSFQEGHVAWDAGEGTGVDLGGPIPIFLTHLGGGIRVNPTVLNAEGAIAGGGHALGCSLFGIHGEITIQFAPFDLVANATGELLCQEVAEEFFHVDEAGDIGVGGSVHLEIYVLSFSAGVDFEISQGHIQFDANVQACIKVLGEHCLSAEAVVSDRGIGVCADLGFTHAGAGIMFPADFKFMLDSCDIAQFRSLPMPANLASAPLRAPLSGAADPLAVRAQALPSFEVPRGEKVAAIGIAGTGGAPNVTLHGPGGRTVSTPADGYLKDPREVVIADGAKTMETYFFIDHPEAGRWQITSNAGSVPVSAVQQSATLPSPDLHAHVSRVAHGRERVRYSLRAAPGQQVTLVDERKGHGFRVLGRAHGAHGAIVFSPSGALGREHEIVAWVSQEGRPREDLTLARYGAAAPGPLSAPRGLSATRHGDTVTLHWHAVIGAKAYALAIGLGRGARQSYAVSAPASGTAVHATLTIPSYLAARITVGAQTSPGHKPGRRAALKLRAGRRPRPVEIAPFQS